MSTNKQLYFYFLDVLKEEMSLYKNEEGIWKLAGGINNAPGNLCLHLCGNLNHYLGAVIGKTGYKRDRPLEFSAKNVSRKELIEGIEKTKIMLERFFDSLPAGDYDKIYPLNEFGENVTYGFVFFILISHLAYHIGQINYHRRITEG